MSTTGGLARTAIVYDFDGTLARGNLQEHSFLPGMKVSAEDFWAEVFATKQKHDADEILVYMWRMLELARSRNNPITREGLRKHGEGIPLFDGLDTWFDRINRYARDEGLLLEHYIVSSGNEEIIRGCSIVSQFRRVFASRYIYDDNDHAVWPGLAINYTSKTQFLFRINKGVGNSWDNEPVNRWIPMEERAVPFDRMLFIGDGDTDIPCMKMVRHQGGYSVAVFDPKADDAEAAQKKLYRLIIEDRVHFVAPADYGQGGQLETIVTGILGRFARNAGRKTEPED